MRFLTVSVLLLLLSPVWAQHTLLVEPELFEKKGGWVVDAQFIDQMGSQYLMAHGLGQPVEDAVGEVTVSRTGIYHVWLRTRNWTSAFSAAGQFHLLINNQPLPSLFGAQPNAGWSWEYGGTVSIGSPKVPYTDAVVTTNWGIDLHYPDTLNSRYFPGEEFVAYAVHPLREKENYTLPYRCFYSRNIANLFMAGRNISVTHVALGGVRVQRCTGMMGELVGIAASLCRSHRCMPRDIYTTHLSQLLETISNKKQDDEL